MIRRANRVQVEDPAASGEPWAEIDRAIVDQAPYLWLVDPTEVGFVSERVVTRLIGEALIAPLASLEGRPRR